MFLLLAGPRAAEVEGTLERMAGRLGGGPGEPRLWRDPERSAGAASLAPEFVPEDAFDRQPLANDDGVFVCQARIDNREELLSRLRLPADAQIADSAVLAAAYARFGDACVRQVVGDFAFAAWHRVDGRVVAGVDHLGTRRLLWSRVGGGIALSPQLPVLLAHPERARDPDLDSLARLFRPGVDRASTPFTSIRALPGGHLLTWRPGGDARVGRWWDPPSEPTVWHSDPNDYVAETRELLERAVRSQLRSSTALSSTLSGGLDSGSVTATAARLLSEPGAGLTAYTSVPEEGMEPSRRPGWEPDDRGYAAEVAARHANVDHVLVPPRGRCVLDVLPEVHERAVTPTKSCTNLLWLGGISSSAAASGSRVVLVGQHGNAGYSWRGENQIWELTRLGRHRAALAQARLEARSRGITVPHVLGGALHVAVRASSRRAAADRFRPKATTLLREPHRRARYTPSGGFAESLGSRAGWVAFATTPKHVWWPDPVPQWGVEWRDPTGDRRLLERLLQFPQAAFRTAGRERGLARAVGEGLLPDRVRLRATQGAQVPEAPSLIAAHADRYESALAEMQSSAGCRELFDFETLRGSLRRLVAGAKDLELALAVDRAMDVGLFLVRLERGP